MRNFKGWDMAALAKKYPEKAKEIFSHGVKFATAIYGSQSKEIKIMVKPMSANVAWKGRRFKSSAYIAYEKEVLWSLPEIVLPEPPYSVSYEFGFSNAGQDLDNSLKQTTDIICKRYKFNDKHIFRFVVDKKITPKGAEYFQFKIESLK